MIISKLNCYWTRITTSMGSKALECKKFNKNIKAIEKLVCITDKQTDGRTEWRTEGLTDRWIDWQVD